VSPRDPARLRALLVSAAAQGGIVLDVDQVLRNLSATVRAFERRRSTPGPVAAAVRRRRLRRLAAAANALEDALAALGRDGRASLDAWASPAEYEAGRAFLERLAGRAEVAIDREGRQARPGSRRDEATRALVLEVAWILGREGLPVSAYPFGLLAMVARDVAGRAGCALWADENIRGQLLPAVRFVRRLGGLKPLSGERNLSPTVALPDPASSPSTRPKAVTH
jgi:hypothetical protein